MKFRKKAVVVEAVRLTPRNVALAIKFCGGKLKSHPMVGVVIETPEGNMIARRGDWIIKGVNGEFYPCKPDIFEKTYEAIE